MFKKSVKWIALVMTVSLLGLTGCAADPASNVQADKMPESIRLAVTDVEGMEELQRDYEAFRTELEKTIETKVEFFAVSDRTAAVAALESDQVDVVLAGPAEYVVLKANNDVSPIVGMQQPNYHSLVVVPADSPIQTITELKGKKISMSDVGSTSGHLAPSKILKDAGVDPLKDAEVIMLGDAHLIALKNGDVDAWAGSWKHFNRFLDKEGLKQERFRILVEGPLLPADVFVASSKLPKAFVASMREKMLANSDGLVSAVVSAEANSKFTDTKLTPANDSDYDYVRGMYEAVGVTDFKQFVGE